MPHFTRQAISRCAETYGWEHDSREQAYRAHNKEVGDGALLRIAQSADGLSDVLLPILKGVQTALLDEARRKAIAEARARINGWIDGREELHGPAPEEVVRWAWQHDAAIAWAILGDFYRAWLGDYPLPEKGGETRRAYDRWMKRKPPKVNSGEA